MIDGIRSGATPTCDAKGKQFPSWKRKFSIFADHHCISSLLTPYESCETLASRLRFIRGYIRTFSLETNIHCHLLILSFVERTLSRPLGG